MTRSPAGEEPRNSLRSQWLFIAAALVFALSFSACRDGSASPKAGYAGTPLSGPAPDLRLIDQRGQAVALSDFRGKVVVLAFLDPVCTDVCPLTALHFRVTAEALGADAGQVAFLAVNTNPRRSAVTDVAEATRRWGVEGLHAWHYLTGPREQLQAAWEAYGILAEGPPKPGKPQELEHTPGVYVIDQAGQRRWYISIPVVEGPRGAAWQGPPLSDLLLKRMRELMKAS